MLYGHDRDAPGNVPFSEALHQVVRRGTHERVEFHDEILSFDRFPQKERWPELASFIGDKYRGVAFDAMVAEGSLALQFAVERLGDVFPGVPVVYGQAFEPVVDFDALPSHVTGIRQPLSFAGTFALARSIQPDAERVVIVGGSAPMDTVMLSQTVRDITPLLGGMELVVLQDWSFDSLLDSLRRLPPRTIIILSVFTRDRAGWGFMPGNLIASITNAASGPVYGVARNWVGKGIVGGAVIAQGDDGARTGQLLLRTLARAPGEPMPAAEITKISLVVDWRQLQRWGLSERRLPQGTQILLREPGVWERYKWEIVSGVSVLVAQTVLIAALLVTRIRRRRAEESLRESESRFRVLANAAPVMIRTSNADALATDFNLPWLEFTGRALDAERGHGWLDGVHPDDRAACVETRRRAFERREAYRMEYRLRRADGEYRWILDSGQMRHTPDGIFAGSIGSAIDITELKSARETLSNLNRQLMDAQEKERSRIARELHDDVCQQLTMFALNLNRLNDTIPASATDARRQVKDLFEELRGLTRHVNGISHQLHPSTLEALGLVTAARMFCEEIGSRHGVSVEFVDEHVPAPLPDGVAINAFRVLQEAMSNAVKHSHASRYRVSLRGTDGQLQLEVSDDGRGFDPAAAQSGLGLITMQERLGLVHGNVVIESRQGSGTRIVATVPLVPAVAPGQNAPASAEQT